MKMLLAAAATLWAINAQAVDPHDPRALPHWPVNPQALELNWNADVLPQMKTLLSDKAVMDANSPAEVKPAAVEAQDVLEAEPLSADWRHDGDVTTNVKLVLNDDKTRVGARLDACRDEAEDVQHCADRQFYFPQLKVVLKDKDHADILWNSDVVATYKPVRIIGIKLMHSLKLSKNFKLGFTLTKKKVDMGFNHAIFDHYVVTLTKTAR